MNDLASTALAFVMVVIVVVCTALVIGGFVFFMASEIIQGTIQFNSWPPAPPQGDR